MLTPGDPLPWFVSRTRTNPQFHIQTVAGRYVVLCCFGSLTVPGAREVVQTFLTTRAEFNDVSACWFGVSIDGRDESSELTADRLPGIRFLWDMDRSVFKALNLISTGGIAERAEVSIRPTTLVLDHRLRVVGVFPFSDPKQHIEAVINCLRLAIANDKKTSGTGTAPVLLLPRVFEPEFCRELIAVYEAHGGEPSGFMLDRDGKTVSVYDAAHKIRRDCRIEDERLKKFISAKIQHRLRPEIQKAFQFDPTRMERYLVACYDAGTGGYFRPHRDNTTRGTAHRKFAVTINLNAEEYEGGDLRFPEFGRETYRAPTGGAVVFSCSLLHEATPVTRGRRYAFVPFLYDDAAAELRRQNNVFLGEGVTPYPGDASPASAEERPMNPNGSTQQADKTINPVFS